jgi:hypothetical protein
VGQEAHLVSLLDDAGRGQAGAKGLQRNSLGVLIREGQRLAAILRGQAGGAKVAAGAIERIEDHHLRSTLGGGHVG